MERTLVLKNAFDAYKSGSLGFRLRPTTASNNKELERQNDILLSGALSRFYQENAQMLQAMVQPNMPPVLAKYYGQVLLSNVALYKTILRNFNHDDVSRLVPDIGKLLEEGQAQGGGGQNPPQNGPMNAGNPGSSPSFAGTQGSIPTGGFQTTGQIPM